MATPPPPADENQQPANHDPSGSAAPSPAYPYGTEQGMPNTPGVQPAAGGLNFAQLTQPRQRGFFIVSIAALVVVVAFFLPDFYAVTVQVTGISVPGLLQPQPLSASKFAAAGAAWLWLVPLCALAAGGLAVWRGVSTQPDTPNGLNRRNTAIAAAALGGVATLLLLVLLVGVQSYCGTALGTVAATGGALTCGSVSILGETIAITGGLGVAYWLLLAAAIGTAAGGILQINTKP